MLQNCDKVDPELDYFSKSFNPQKYLDQIVPKSVRQSQQTALFDNINQFNQALAEAGGSITTKILKPIVRKPSKKQLGTDTTVVRRFEEHQQPVTRERSNKYTRNIVKALEGKQDTGFKVILKKFMDETVRVKINTRKEKGVRGSITGYIAAFDKHWNIALVDVVETWTRRKYAYSDCKMADMVPLEADVATKRLTAMGISVPKLHVRSVDRKYVECTRRLPQMLVRGEQVVLVTREKSLL